MKTVVCAYHNIGCRCLEVLLNMEAEIAAVFTHRDNPGENIWFDSVEKLARKNGLSCHTPEDINQPCWAGFLRELAPDFLFSFYYRNLFGREILSIPSRGAINLHGSYLPRYRGRCPVNWVLVNGEQETGVTLHYMVEKPDAGDIITQERVPIDPDDTALTLFRKLEKPAETLLQRTFPLLMEGRAPRIPQEPGSGSYFGGRKPEDGRIHWGKSAREIYNLVRAVTHPYPGAFAFLGGKKVYVWKAKVEKEAPLPFSGGTFLGAKGDALRIATGEGAILLEECQLEGREEGTGRDLLLAFPLERGERFT